jgi:hypothetical protein
VQGVLIRPSQAGVLAAVGDEPSLIQRSFIPLPARILGMHFSMRDTRVADCFAPEKYRM